MLKLIHAADLHLDSAFGSLPEEKARMRRRESRLVLDRLVQSCRDYQADALLLAGDLFDGEHVYADTLTAFALALKEVPCPVFIAPGNHDPYTPQSAYTKVSWPDNVTIFTQETVTAVDCGSFVVHGAAFVREEARFLLQGFTAPEDGKRHVMVLHGDTESKDSPYNPVTREQIAASRLDYLALGHIHLRSEPKQEGKTVYAYPGCPEGRGFDELGRKGALLVSIDEETTHVEFLPMGKRRYEILTVDVTGREPLAAIRAELPDGHEDDCYRIILQGEAKEPMPEEWQRRLSEEFFSLELRDETVLPRELWSRAGEDSLRGLFLSKVKEKYDAGSEEEKKIAEQAARFVLDLMDNRDV